MTSFLSRMANEATAALSDAYGHVMHGDDAGSSARVVWVVHPARVAVDLSDVGLGRVEEESPGGRGYGFTQKFGEFM
jgi:hypothetical protein